MSGLSARTSTSSRDMWVLGKLNGEILSGREGQEQLLPVWDRSVATMPCPLVG